MNVPPLRNENDFIQQKLNRKTQEGKINVNTDQDEKHINDDPIEIENQTEDQIEHQN